MKSALVGHYREGANLDQGLAVAFAVQTELESLCRWHIVGDSRKAGSVSHKEVLSVKFKDSPARNLPLCVLLIPLTVTQSEAD